MILYSKKWLKLKYKREKMILGGAFSIYHAKIAQPMQPIQIKIGLKGSFWINFHLFS